jgi:hypothetical protein
LPRCLFVCKQVRDFLLSKLYQLRKPKTNISIIQQNVLLKYKYFVRFLAEHGPDVHQEVSSSGRRREQQCSNAYYVVQARGSRNELILYYKHNVPGQGCRCNACSC